MLLQAGPTSRPHTYAYLTTVATKYASQKLLGLCTGCHHFLVMQCALLPVCPGSDSHVQPIGGMNGRSCCHPNSLIWGQPDIKTVQQDCYNYDSLHESKLVTHALPWASTKWNIPARVQRKHSGCMPGRNLTHAKPEARPATCAATPVMSYARGQQVRILQIARRTTRR